RPVVKGVGTLREVPRIQRYATRPSHEILLKAYPRKHRRAPDSQIYSASVEYGYTMQEIARHLGLHYATVSRAVPRAEEQATAGHPK
ncbi:MAG: hypothetical protein ACREJQ_07665, partial [bacterium]